MHCRGEPECSYMHCTVTVSQWYSIDDRTVHMQRQASSRYTESLYTIVLQHNQSSLARRQAQAAISLLVRTCERVAMQLKRLCPSQSR